MEKEKATIFLVLDTSGHMKPTMMSALNFSVSELIESLKRFSDRRGNFDLSIAIVEYNSGANWILHPTSLSDAKWDTIISGGLCDLGAGITELKNKLNEFLGENEKDTDQDYYPIFIFMLAGYSTDDYLLPLNVIQNNLWFKKGVKIAFAIGEDSDIGALENITGTSEAIITITDLENFKDLFRLVKINKKNIELDY